MNIYICVFERLLIWRRQGNIYAVVLFGSSAPTSLGERKKKKRKNKS